MPTTKIFLYAQWNHLYELNRYAELRLVADLTGFILSDYKASVVLTASALRLAR